MIRVMIVEDQKLVRSLLESYIQNEDGYQLAVSIPGAAEAPILCDTEDIDLVLMDVQTEHRENGLAAAEKTEIDWADRIRSDKRKADLHLTIHFIQWEIEFQSRTSGWRIRMLDCFEFYIFTPDYVLRFSVDYDRNIQDILLRDRAADTKQEMA